MDASTAVARYFNCGRLEVIPRKRAARLAVLDLLADQFEPGRHYPEAVVNRALSRAHADFCSLRRYLVDEGFMDRDGGVYWRAGGTFVVDRAPRPPFDRCQPFFPSRVTRPGCSLSRPGP
ncbi:MAG TPA: DUF2087 domain-containing protein [Acidimicrobiales bacterium]|nr:DUF2087 domain-containing protein [Acidimicrobiales bacterium]